MHHTCYHLISDNKNEFLNALNEVKERVDHWKQEGESHIKVFKITTEELGSDAINLEETQVGMDEINVK